MIGRLSDYVLKVNKSLGVIISKSTNFLKMRADMELKKHVLFSIVFAVVLLSCIKEPSLTTQTVVRNESSYLIRYIIYGYNTTDYTDTINILADSQYLEENFSDDGSFMIFPIGSDSVKIIFNTDKQLVYVHYIDDTNRDRNPYSIDAYNKEKMTDEYYRFTYSFTNEDYKNALPIE
nr:hypothetical protein [uncultured Carboxylicivirga sp.]